MALKAMSSTWSWATSALSASDVSACGDGGGGDSVEASLRCGPTDGWVWCPGGAGGGGEDGNGC